MDVDLSDYIDEYLIELEEQLDRLNDTLMTLEKEPSNQEVIKEIFRITHTIKGSASTMGFEQIAAISHAFEDLLGEAREGAVRITPPIIDSMIKAYDGIYRLKENLTNPEAAAVQTSELVEQLKRHLPDAQLPATIHQRVATEAAEAATPAPAGPEAGAGGGPRSESKEPPGQLSPELEGLLSGPQRKTYRFRLQFEPQMEMKSVRAFLVIKKLKEIGQILQSEPSIASLEGNADPSFTHLELYVQTAEAVEKLEQVAAFGNSLSSEVTVVDRVPGGAAASPAPTAGPAARKEQPAAVRPPAGPAGAAKAARPEPAESRDRVSAASSPAKEELLEDESYHEGGSPEEIEAQWHEAARAAGFGAAPQARTTRLLDQLSEEQRVLVVESLNQNLNVFEVEILFQDSSSKSMTRAWQIWQRVSDVARIILSDPVPEAIHRGFEGNLQLLIATEKEIEHLKDMMVAEEVGKSSFTSIAMERMEPMALTEPSSGPAPGAGAGGRSVDPHAPEGARITATQTVRVPVDRLNKLMNLVGELVINKTQFVNLFARYMESGDAERLRSGIQELNQSLSTITNELQTGIMKVRMVQIGQVFSRFTRLVRDLSKSLGKKVTLLIEGAETEIDKNVIDEIGDPLMHLVRNSLDHGIESPEVRRMKGKPEEGFLMLRARHVGENIIVETVDDGAGIDLERIKKRALERGLTDEVKLRAMSTNEIYNFIFYPGFSTASQVSNVSGRGVGMDVVKESIQKLRGEITIKSEKDNGTTIQIKLPLTLAIIQGLLVRVGNETFAVPLSSVRETIQLDPENVHVINNHRVINFRESVIPLIFLQDYFELEHARSDKSFIVFAEDDDNRIGLVVDSLIGRREIVSKTLDKRFVAVKGVQGATVLGDGTVSLILDVPALVDDAKTRFYH